MEGSCLRKTIFQGELQITDFLTRALPVVIYTSVIYRASKDTRD